MGEEKMTWENILKGSWSTRNFKILKQTALELIESLGEGEHFITDLYPKFHELMKSKTKGTSAKPSSGYNNWSKNHGKKWFIQKFPRIARNAGLEIAINPRPIRRQVVIK